MENLGWILFALAVGVAVGGAISTKGLAGLGVVDLGTNPLAVERIGDLLAGLKLHGQLEDTPHQLGFVFVDGVSPVDNI